MLTATIALWYRSLGSVSVDTIVRPKAEVFYWATILFSQTLGTALGDFLAGNGGLGYRGAAIVFAAGLVALVLLYITTNVSRVVLFWAAFILTRPFGATLGDFLDKPIAHGGLAMSRFSASFALLLFIGTCLMILPQRPGRHPSSETASE